MTGNIGGLVFGIVALLVTIGSPIVLTVLKKRGKATEGGIADQLVDTISTPEIIDAQVTAVLTYLGANPMLADKIGDWVAEAVMAIVGHSRGNPTPVDIVAARAGYTTDALLQSVAVKAVTTESPINAALRAGMTTNDFGASTTAIKVAVAKRIVIDSAPKKV